MNIPYPNGNKSKGINPVHFKRVFPMRFKIAETHHGYYGLILMIVGIYLIAMGIK